jgi:uncharacterized HAD superfamily protein
MGFIKKIKNYFKKKKQIKVLNTQSIPNFEAINNENKTIVFISGAMPTHDKDSGSNRLLEIILAFKKLNYNCIICVENVFEDDIYVQFYKQLGVTVYVESLQFNSYKSFLKSVNSIDYIWYYGPNTLKNYLNKVSKFLPKAKSIFDMVDIHFLRYKRAIELNPTRISLKKRFRKYFTIETQLAKKVDFVIAISDKEKTFMSDYLPKNEIITISNVHYPKVKQEDIPSFDNRENLLFIGSAHTPNIDAVHYLYDEIMPLVWDKLPNVKVQIIGSVDKEINTISNKNIEFLGFVENVEPYFLNSKLMIAPLRYGAGVKGKVGQAFEYYLPVVTTSIGAEGMFLENDINAIIVDNATDFANKIIEVYNQSEIWEKLSKNSELSLYPFSKEKLEKTITQF